MQKQERATGTQSVSTLGALEADLIEAGITMICGVDEVGRGPLAGPVVAAAVILPDTIEPPGLNDSKKLTARKRESLYNLIRDSATCHAISVVDHTTIDEINILQASLLAMRRAVEKLGEQPEIVLVDGNRPIPQLSTHQRALIGGDATCRCIAAASILAKVTRDRMMADYQDEYPSFSFGKHKGYPTPVHLGELRTHGPTPIHRRSFRPVAELIEQKVFFERE